MAGGAYASFLTDSAEAALTVDAVAGKLSGLGSAWQTIYPAVRVFGRLQAIGQYTLFAQAGSLTPYALAVQPAGPADPQGYTVASLAAALLATSASYGNGPLYTFTPSGWASVTRVRTTLNAVDGSPYSVELQANPIQGGLDLVPA